VTFTKEGYQKVTKVEVEVKAGKTTLLDVQMMMMKPSLGMAWIVPPSPEMAVGESQTVRWLVTGDPVTGTALVCSASEDSDTEATETIPGVEVAPSEYKATITVASPGQWHFAAVAQVDGDTIATEPVKVAVE
jgi:predicted aspartyl protease